MKPCVLKPSVLVIRFGAMGDLLHVSPSLRLLSKQYPEATVHALTQPLYVDLVRQFEGVKHVWAFQKPKSIFKNLKVLYTLAQQLRAAGITHVVNLHPSLNTWLLTKWLGVQHVAVYRKQKIRVFGKTQREQQSQQPFGQARLHAVEDFYRPFQQLFGLPQASKVDLLPRLGPLREKPDSNKAPGPVIGIIPGVGSKRSNRAWPLASYAQLINRLLTEQPDCRIRLFGGPDERALAQTLIETVGLSAQDASDCDFSGRIENHCGRWNILQTAEQMRACQLIIGGDTGPLHMATAVGVPIIGLYGPTSLQRTGPLGENLSGSQPVVVLTPPDSLACWPCEKPSCGLSGEAYLACQAQLAVEAVRLTVLRLLRRHCLD